MKKTRTLALGIGLSWVVAACGGDDTTGASPGTGGAGQAGSNGTAGSGLGGGGRFGAGGSISQVGGNAGAGGNAGSAGNAGGGGTAGAGGSAVQDAGADVSVTPDSATVDASDAASSVDTGIDTGAVVDASSEALGPADSGVDVGIVKSCDAGEGLQLKSVPGLNQTGWIDRSTNCVGIQGAIYLGKDSVSDIIFTSTTNHFCISGHAIKTTTFDPNHWGVFVAIQLNHSGFAETPYDATSHGVTGFDFTLSGVNVPTSMRAQYRVDGQGVEYCKVIGGAGTKSILITEGHPECYLPDAGPASPNAAVLTRLEFMVPSNTTADVAFDFCVDNLTAKKQ